MFHSQTVGFAEINVLKRNTVFFIGFWPESLKLIPSTGSIFRKLMSGRGSATVL